MLFSACLDLSSRPAHLLWLVALKSEELSYDTGFCPRHSTEERRGCFSVSVILYRRTSCRRLVLLSISPCTIDAPVRGFSHPRQTTFLSNKEQTIFLRTRIGRFQGARRYIDYSGHHHSPILKATEVRDVCF